MLVGNECWLYLLGLLVFAVFIIICVVCVKLERLTLLTKGRLLLLMCVLIGAIIYNFFYLFLFFTTLSTRLLHPETPLTLKTCLILTKQFNAVVPSSDAKHNVPNMLVVGDAP